MQVQVLREYLHSAEVSDPFAKKRNYKNNQHFAPRLQWLLDHLPSIHEELRVKERQWLEKRRLHLRGKKVEEIETKVRQPPFIRIVLEYIQCFHIQLERNMYVQLPECRVEAGL